MDGTVNNGDARVKTAVEEKFNDWTIGFTRSHILHSQCTSKDACADPEGKKCLLCLYNSILELPQMPDMVFPNNVLWVKHNSGCGIEFKALDALKRVCNGKQGIKIACSDSWKESREEASKMTEYKPFDWTFTTDYSGSLVGGFVPTPTTERINLDKLTQKEKILFYEDLTLFEDELHDNGIAVCSIKIRVMPSSFYILLRFFLRVDDVLVRINDTRIYHEFGTDCVLREYTSREAKVADLKIPSVALTEPNEVAPHLPLVNSCYEKLSLPSLPTESAVADA